MTVNQKVEIGQSLAKINAWKTSSCLFPSTLPLKPATVAYNNGTLCFPGDLFSKDIRSYEKDFFQITPHIDIHGHPDSGRFLTGTFHLNFP